jgi:glycosyltransferase involved in cell wall biosynthesis
MPADVRVEALSAHSLAHRYDVLHVHWPDSLLNLSSRIEVEAKLAAFFAIAKYLHWRGTKIVWTMHNLKAHDGRYPVLEARYWRRFIPLVDGVISLSKTGVVMAQSKFPRLQGVPTIVTPHGHYRDEYPTAPGNVREALGISEHARVILFFGAVRAYKNIHALIGAFRNVSDPDAVLLIVGQPDTDELAKSILSEAATDARVRVVFEFVRPEQVGKFMHAADLVVLPYRAILNSGSALLALSFNRPILVPDLGSIADLKADFGGDWVMTYGGEVDGTILERALTWAMRPRPEVCPIKEDYDWKDIQGKTIKFYQRVIDSNRTNATQ